MNIEEQLMTENSKRNWNILITEIVKNPGQMTSLMKLYFNEEYHRSMRSSQVVSQLFAHRPDLIEPYLIQMANYLDDDPPTAIKRSVMRIYQWTEIDEEVEGKLFDYAIKYMRSKDEPIAIKAFSMTVARRICERYPELAPEAIAPIEILVEENYSTGTVNRGKKELKKLRKLL
ncbi:hypothetical protein JYT74_02200 [Crocinitomix catalasitica]|nr:hypothetical protein [Crocinitomix catalasitica]